MLIKFTTTATNAVKHDVFSLAITFLYLLDVFTLEEISQVEFSS